MFPLISGSCLGRGRLISMIATYTTDDREEIGVARARRGARNGIICQTYQWNLLQD